MHKNMKRFINILLTTMLIYSSFSTETIYAEFLFKSSNTVNMKDEEGNLLAADELLKLAFDMSISVYKPTENLHGGIDYVYTVNKADAEMQKYGIEMAIEMGANLHELIKAKSDHLDIGTLYFNRELFLEHLDPNTFAKLVLNYEISLLNDPFIMDENLAQLQSELLESAIKQGADINQVFKTSRTIMDTLNLNKDFLIKEMGASKFLMILIHKAVLFGKTYEEMALKLAQLAIDHGADPNFTTNNGLKIELSSLFKDNIKLLKFLIDNGARHCADARNRVQEFYDGGLGELLSDPQIVIDQKYKNLGAHEAFEAKMPYILHHIWLTHASAPREMLDTDIDNVIATKNLFSQAAVQWQHIIWTNDPQLFPESVEKLKGAGIKVQCIYEHKKDLKLFKLIEGLIDQKLWGQASDTLRISLVEHFGGVYADLNYTFSRHVTSETHKYNFFTSTYNDVYYIANFFFGSTAKHPILQKALSLIERNIVTPPAYITLFPNQSPNVITSTITANPICLAYYSQANKDDNIDVIYPPTPDHEKLKYTSHDYDESLGHPNSKEINEILKSICPLQNFYFYIHAKEICGSDSHKIGADSLFGGTWKVN